MFAFALGKEVLRPGDMILAEAQVSTQGALTLDFDAAGVLG